MCFTASYCRADSDRLGHLNAPCHPVVSSCHYNSRVVADWTWQWNVGSFQHPPPDSHYHYGSPSGISNTLCVSLCPGMSPGVKKTEMDSPSPQESSPRLGFTQHHRPVIAVHSGQYTHSYANHIHRRRLVTVATIHHPHTCTSPRMGNVYKNIKKVWTVNKKEMTCRTSPQLSFSM